jgi:Siphovirus ReqiPepy6 Gp37-like protein
VTVGRRWSAFSRDAGYQLSGGLPIITVKGAQRHLGVDACELTTPYTPDAYGRLAPGCGIVVQRDVQQMFSGLVGSSRKISWDRDSGRATITVQCLGDDQHLADRLVYPTPGALPMDQTADYWTYTGPASTAMWRLISDQAGPAAQTARRIPTLVMGDDPGIGTSRLWSEQWAPVLDTVTAWGVLSGADLGVRLTTTGDGLRADVYAPRDVSDGVRFSASLTNLRGWDYEQTPPTVTYAIAAGQGDLRNRVRRRTDSTSVADLAWGRRIETYLDSRDEADVGKLQTAADDAVAQGIGTVSLSVAVADTATAAFGVDWGLGDRVTVHVGLPGGVTAATIVDLVREVGFEVDSSGRETITPAVGTADAKAIRPGPTQKTLAKVATGLSRLTRNQ